MKIKTIGDAVSMLREMESSVHYEVYKRIGRTGSLFEMTFGMCDFMTAWALQKIQEEACRSMHFVGIDIPRREIKGRVTYPSHTVGILYGFEEDREKVVWFDYACAQYNIREKSLVNVLDRADLYHTLARTYGGGVWCPGGSWLSQLDLDDFGHYVSDLNI